MRHLGDFLAASTVRASFNTCDPTTGAPITLAGSPVVSVYKDGGTTQSTAGVSLTVDFDAVTGFHLVTVDTSADAAFYSVGSDYQAVLTAGTIGGTSGAGAVLFSFSIQRTVAGIVAQGTLDAGTVSSFTIPSAQRANIRAGQSGLLILSGSGAGQFKTIATYDSATGVGAPGPTNFAVAPGTARFVVLSLAEASSDVASITTQLNAIEADTQDIQSRIPTALVGGRIDASVGAMASGTVTNAAVATGALDANKFAAGAITATVLADGAITAAKVATGAIDADALATDAVNEIADGLLGRNIAGGSSTGRTVRQALAFNRNRVVIDATTVTVYAEDDTTILWTGSVIRTSGLNPLAAVDPA